MGKSRSLKKLAPAPLAGSSKPSVKLRSLSELMSKADLKFEKKQFHRKVRDSVAALRAQKAIEKDPQILMESGTEPVTEHAMEDITEPVTEPALGAVTEPVTESAMEAVMKPPETIWKSTIARCDRVLRSSDLPLTSEKGVGDSVAALSAQKTIEKKKKLRSRQKKLKAYDLSSVSEFLPELKIPRQPSPAAEFKLNCKSKQKLM
ncbi:hypothetical protein ACB098_02G209100 [Castanea mollissima]